MYIDADTIIKAASLIGALGALGGVVIALYRQFESNKKQSEVIKAMQDEQTITCYGVLACLKGLKEQGCNGPVTDALNMIEKHLNKAAHHPEL